MTSMPTMILAILSCFVFFACGPRSGVTQQNASHLNLSNAEASIKTAPEIVTRSTVLLDMGYNYCTGTIVDWDKILTAAHCVGFIDDAQNIIVRFGPDVRDLRYGRVGQGKPRLHDKLDMAVIQVADIPLGYEPARIFTADERLFKNDAAVLAGYGKTRADRRDFAEYLRWGSTRFDTFLSQIDYSDGQSFRSILRFRGEPGAAASCGGDSGGPIYRYLDGEWGLTGVISGGPIQCHLYSETLAADPRPNRDWILAEFSDSSQTCTVADTAGDEGTNLRFWGLETLVNAVVKNGVTLPLMAYQPDDLDIERHLVRVSGYIPTAATSCSEDPRECIQRYSNVRTSGTADELLGLSGVAIFVDPSRDSEILGVVADDQYIRVIDRRKDGWLRVDFEATIGEFSCPLQG